MTKTVAFVAGAILSPLLILTISELTGHLHIYGQGSTGLGRLLCIW